MLSIAELNPHNLSHIQPLFEAHDTLGHGSAACNAVSYMALNTISWLYLSKIAGIVSTSHLLCNLSAIAYNHAFS